MPHPSVGASGALFGLEGALISFFLRHRERLRKMVRLRLDRRLYGRLDESDVLQEAYLDVLRRFAEFAANPVVPFCLWVRALTGQRLIDLQISAALPIAGK